MSCLRFSLKHAHRPRKVKYVKFTCRIKSRQFLPQALVYPKV